MKLELKHLAPYLPYGLKALVSDLRFGIGDPFLDKITGMYEDLVTFNDSPDWYFDSYENDTEIKLALRPLSDLTKEIEHNGEKFVPSELLNFDFSDLSQFDYDYIPYNLAIFLLEHHFDIFGLIENGLAIDINTLCVNK